MKFLIRTAPALITLPSTYLIHWPICWYNLDSQKWSKSAWKPGWNPRIPKWSPALTRCPQDLLAALQAQWTKLLSLWPWVRQMARSEPKKNQMSRVHVLKFMKFSSRAALYQHAHHFGIDYCQNCTVSLQFWSLSKTCVQFVVRWQFRSQELENFRSNWTEDLTSILKWLPHSWKLLLWKQVS